MWLPEGPVPEHAHRYSRCSRCRWSRLSRLRSSSSLFSRLRACTSANSCLFSSSCALRSWVRSCGQQQGPDEYLSGLACLPWLPQAAPNTVPHLTLCGQPTGAQVQLLVGLTQLLALDLKLCSLQLQPRQAAPQLPTFTLELTSLPRHLSQ